MKKQFILRSHFIAATCLAVLNCGLPTFAQSPAPVSNATSGDAKTLEAKSKSDADTEQKAAEWVGSLKLGDAAKSKRVTEIVATHLKAVRDWHNEHPFTSVPAGTNAATGKPLNQLEREMIADGAMPKSVHDNLMTGLRKELSPEQVESILDKYTVGKVAFTMNGYRAIVPDLTAEEEKTILGFLKQAREEAVDYKNMKEISAVFEIYKTKSEQHLNSNGRDWKKMYKAYTDAIKAKKAEAAKQKAAAENPAGK
ncbi:MAG: DUF3826 domain-containing protein [Verrucomicrobia bacterium]|nr:MAG: DUF3826 domain-containing protein [Verrucomicrobiota bacterium]